MTSAPHSDHIADGYSSSTPCNAMSNRLTWQLTLFFIFNIFIVNGCLAVFSPGGFDDTALKQSWDMLRGISGDDSWGPMAAALGYVSEQQQAGKPLYQVIFFEEGIKFQYPPSALFGLEGMMIFGEERVRTYDGQVFSSWPPINDLIGWTLLAITAFCSAALLELGFRQSAPGTHFNSLALLRAILAIGFTLTFFPAIKAFTLGQIQLWINALFAVVMLLFVLKWRAVSGALFGVICLMKPHYGLFVLWGALNRHWRYALACVVVGAFGLIASIWHYGWVNHLDYLRVLSFMSERGEVYHANQSINGLLNRLATLFGSGSSENETFNAYGFPPYNPFVYWGTIISSAIILMAAFLRKSSDEQRVLAFSIVAVSMTIASPIAWEHHYGLFLPVFAFIAGSLAGYRQKLFLLGVCYLFVSNFVPAFNLLANTPLNVLQSYTLAGGLGFLVLMHFHLSALRAHH